MDKIINMVSEFFGKFGGKIGEFFTMAGGKLGEFFAVAGEKISALFANFPAQTLPFIAVGAGSLVLLVLKLNKKN